MSPAAPSPSNQASPAVTIVPSTLGSCAVRAGGLLGLEFSPITVEVATRRGPGSFQMAGLAETAVREARIRISSALCLLGIHLDEYSLTVNLAPAHLRKSGSGLDFAIAVAILGAVGKLQLSSLGRHLFVGEVGLDGSIRPVPGVLPILDGAAEQGFSHAYVPAQNAKEASQLSDIEVRGVRDLPALLAHIEGDAPIFPSRPAPYHPQVDDSVDFSEVRGHHLPKRALLIAAAGFHHALLMGPPGSGKSLLARRMPSLLPAMDLAQAMQTTKVHSVSGLVRPEQGVIERRPFRAPHHTVSAAGLIGGGSIPRPGEVSLAHHGVLFLDELGEFRRGALEALRQPLEDHFVDIVRTKMRARFFARPLVVAAMNPCPCGNFGNPLVACRCSVAARLRYLAKISGPLLDRLDLHVQVTPVNFRALCGRPPSASDLSSKAARKLVQRARAAQASRAKKGLTRRVVNSDLTLDELDRVVPLDRPARALIDAALKQGVLSARGYVRVLRIARSIADLEGSPYPHVAHLGEALRYRTSDLSKL